VKWSGPEKWDPISGPSWKNRGKKPVAVRKLTGYGEYRGRSKKKNNSIDVLTYDSLNSS
jgi:hypothetical protein